MKRLAAKSLSIKYMTEREYTAGNVERFVAAAQRSFDLFGIFDVLAFNDTQTIGVQVTTAHNRAAHIQTLESKDAFWRWIKPDNRFAELHLWKRATKLVRRHSMRRYRYSNNEGTWMEIAKL